MATRPKTPVDPAEQHNKKILQDIQDREEAKQTKRAAPILDMLGVKVETKEPTNAIEFIDEFDKKNFGQPQFTTRVLYGPDNLLRIPFFKQKIDEMGLEDFAAMVYDAIMVKEEMAIDDPLLRRGLREGIRKYGKHDIAMSFKRRILEIPSKIVNIEVDKGDDDEVLGHPLEDAVRRFGSPGMAPKFMSERCIALRGRQGYQVVMDAHGDPVKVGTLIMGEIPETIAARRRLKYAEESDDAIKQQNEAYITAQSRFLEKAQDIPAETLKGTSFLSSGTSIEGRDSDLKDVTTGLVIERT